MSIAGRNVTLATFEDEAEAAHAYDAAARRAYGQQAIVNFQYIGVARYEDISVETGIRVPAPSVVGGREFGSLERTDSSVAPAASPRSPVPVQTALVQAAAEPESSSEEEEEEMPMPVPVAAPVPPSPWSEHTAPGGFPYWYNQNTRASVWERPAEHQVAVAAVSLAPPPKKKRNKKRKQLPTTGPPALPPASLARTTSAEAPQGALAQRKASRGVLGRSLSHYSSSGEAQNTGALAALAQLSGGSASSAASDGRTSGGLGRTLSHPASIEVLVPAMTRTVTAQQLDLEDKEMPGAGAGRQKPGMQVLDLEKKGGVIYMVCEDRREEPTSIAI